MWKLFFVLTWATISTAATYQHTAPKFTVSYDDKTWAEASSKKDKTAKEDVDRKMAGNTLLVLSRIEADDKYHSRFSVVVDEKFKDKGSEQLKFYVADARKFLAEQGFDLSEAKPAKLPGVDVPVVEYQGSQRHLGLTFLQYVFTKNGQAFLLTGATRKAKYDEQQKELRAMIDSFRF